MFTLGRVTGQGPFFHHLCGECVFHLQPASLGLVQPSLSTNGEEPHGWGRTLKGRAACHTSTAGRRSSVFDPGKTAATRQPSPGLPHLPRWVLCFWTSRNQQGAWARALVQRAGPRAGCYGPECSLMTFSRHPVQNSVSVVHRGLPEAVRSRLESLPLRRKGFPKQKVLLI